MAADVLATQGAGASAAMILTYLNRDNSVPARLGLTLLMLETEYCGFRGQCHACDTVAPKATRASAGMVLAV